MASIYDWSKTAASNSNADAAINWAEGMDPAAVNDSARQEMARIAEFRDDITGTITAGGTANALTVTANSGFTTLANGRMVAFIAASDNTAASTLAVNGLTAKSIRKMDQTGDVALTGGEIQAGGVYLVVYNAAMNGAAGAWLLINPTNPPVGLTETASTSGTAIDFTGIPSTATEITIALSGVSTNGSSQLLMQLGDGGGIETSGYLGSQLYFFNGGSSGSGVNLTGQSGFILSPMSAPNAVHGIITLRRAIASSFTWVCTGLCGKETTFSDASLVAGSKATSAQMDRVRITTIAGTDTFDAGKITLSYQ
jgi:hypothetical protein